MAALCFYLHVRFEIKSMDFCFKAGIGQRVFFSTLFEL